jgi:hypothetical protein
VISDEGPGLGAAIIGFAYPERMPRIGIVRAVRERAPHLPIIAVCQVDPRDTAQICALGSVGVQDMIFINLPDALERIPAMLDAAEAASASATVLRALQGQIPAELRRFVEACLRPRPPATIEEIAADLDRLPSSLGRLCREFAFPTPERTKMFLRLMLAAVHLSGTNRSARTIATDLKFSSDNAMHNLVRGYVGVASSELRNPDGLERVIEAFTKEREVLGWANAPSASTIG